ncbi:Rossmann-like and DUF2520 domain-containing protein [Vulgatibacter incomptus]|uniref:Ketopantoate reductase PanG n=1 Tax=Vulgatibacter incomptus TaxID=1391653 RepID=A0A0K1PAD7_9BACT|nr:Rossmann-like and DUF2520 domain-containing protein [Vulgatibacter incomptus]AKU90480.1 Ketopantoate reductase PanG [Vulgatibacter incomptus]
MSSHRSSEVEIRGPHLERERSRHTVYIVGAGRLGSAVARGLAAAGWEVRTWSRSPERRVEIAGVEHRSGELPDRLPGELVLLTVSDRVVAPISVLLAETGRIAGGQVVAHCAGALDLAPLEPLRQIGAQVGSLHPLVAASGGRVELRGRSAAVDGDPEAVRLLKRVARDLDLRTIAVPAKERPRYHAAAALAANGLVSLTDLAVGLLEGAEIPREAALDALVPLLESSLQGLAERRLPGALTGPVARGDAAVVQDHLRALAGTAALDAYRALSVHALELARAQGTADPAGLERIAELLGP